MNPIEIRKATITDLEAIQNISTQTFIETFAAVNTTENIENYVTESFNSEQLTSEINNADSQFYLATSGNEILGYLKINFGNAQTETINKNALEVHRIYVSQAFHGKNVGQLLIDEVKKIAQDTGVDYIWLGVWEENHRALRFYTKNGFVEFDKHVFTLGNEEQTDLLMQHIINKKQ
ncbi:MULTISPECIES: GNAT family N-acetyltransferase [Flavobacterium]|uniref:GNAT family N-acetyltransferase n=1 Tax=Flavobacterium gawalongense TaxID=2594432 RepID=A0A553BVA6_9FLAO|nr:N-acetyltransferase [Flavobacterium gawalongense]TRX02721.1 GNAT family N-acetyltransferase [Flavobacterium gawalongense]TRX08029.1 GNAT family N-acetyltransferase [Flavobacterium gawalongense]TRX10934.1 GNAT family N-acetyltransferase [Flavobacterium gawalongense]TRX12180.1 GNAT family N-acetyltransferase [Flavobacterium gawalongense]TRX25152.1 GNAT family N-acetyltransferase [Flavobacterium gawalongense]